MLGLAPMYNEIVARHRPQPENQKAFLPGADNLDESSHIIRDQSVFTNQLKLWVEMLVFTHQPSSFGKDTSAIQGAL